MLAPLNDYLNSDELRLLTSCASAHLQVEFIKQMGIPFELDSYECPLVRYQDAKDYFLQLGKSLPRSSTD